MKYDLRVTKDEVKRKNRLRLLVDTPRQAARVGWSPGLTSVHFNDTLNTTHGSQIFGTHVEQRIPRANDANALSMKWLAADDDSNEKGGGSYGG